MATQEDDKRAKLLAAAHAVMARRGLVGCTTREIAREAGVAEGTIYNYFRDKVDLCLSVLRERHPLPQRLFGLAQRAGERPPREVLVEIGEEVLGFLQELIPMFSGVVGNPELAAGLRRDPGPRRGPLAPVGALEEYLRAEQGLGNLGPSADPQMLARVLFASLFHQAYLTLLLGEERLELRGRAFVERLVDTVLAAAGPRPERGARGVPAGLGRRGRGGRSW